VSNLLKPRALRWNSTVSGGCNSSTARPTAPLAWRSAGPSPQSARSKSTAWAGPACWRPTAYLKPLLGAGAIAQATWAEWHGPEQMLVKRATGA